MVLCVVRQTVSWQRASGAHQANQVASVASRRRICIRVKFAFPLCRRRVGGESGMPTRRRLRQVSHRRRPTSARLALESRCWLLAGHCAARKTSEADPTRQPVGGCYVSRAPRVHCVRVQRRDSRPKHSQQASWPTSRRASERAMQLPPTITSAAGLGAAQTQRQLNGPAVC